MSQFTYDYVNIAPPGVSEDFVTGINDVGQIVGWFVPAGPPFEWDFIYTNGTYTILPRNWAIQVTGGINDEGQVVGYGHLSGGGYDFGFLYSGGTYTNYNYPGPLGLPGTHFTGINDLGQIVGMAGAIGGFLYSGGTYTTIEYPLATVSYANGINDGSEIVGYYLDSADVAHGFLFDNGTYTALDNPLATGGTYLTGINNTGQIVGYYYDATGHQHGFLYNSGTYTPLDNPLGVGGTSLTGINDYGQIVGNYLDSAGQSHGFLGTLAFSAAVTSKVVYTKEYGFAPDAAQLNVLVEFTTPQYAYAQQVGIMSPPVYAYEALGVALASTATLFQNTYDSSNQMYPNTVAGDAQFVADAYNDVFGHPGSSAQVQHFVDQLNFVEAVYTASGSFGSAANVDLLARGAIYGQMLGIHAEVDPFGPGGAAGTGDVSLVGISAMSDTTQGVLV